MTSKLLSSLWIAESLGGDYGNALQAAASCGSVKAIRFLLDRGANINEHGGYYGNALQAAASSGNIKIVRFLLDNGADISVQGEYYGNALQAVASNDNVKATQLLLGKLADVNLQGRSCRIWWQIETIQALWDKAADDKDL